MAFISDGTNASLTTSNNTQTRLLTLDFGGAYDALNLALFYALVDALGASISPHLADADTHTNGADLTAIAMVTPAPPPGDLWRYFSYLNSLCDAVVDHATRSPGNVHAALDTSASITNVMASDPATDVATGITRANLLKLAINEHYGNLVSHSNVTDPVTESDAAASFNPGIGKASVSVNALSPDTTPIEGRTREYKVGLMIDDSGVMDIIGTPTNVLDAFEPGGVAVEFTNVVIGVTGGTFWVDVVGSNVHEIVWSGNANVGFEFVTA